ncbi:MAG TPA: hypothetical protein VIX18_12305, partial [Nitrospirota bacterium]
MDDPVHELLGAGIYPPLLADRTEHEVGRLFIEFPPQKARLDEWIASARSAKQTILILWRL